MEVVNWQASTNWRRRGDGFLVEINHREIPDPQFGGWSSDFGPHHWCVYAYIYPSHPLFATFGPVPDMFQPAANDMPLHGGCTYLSYHHRTNSAGEVERAAIQAGCDYRHDGDDWYTNDDEGHRVFADADLLFRWLSDAQKKAEVGCGCDPEAGITCTPDADAGPREQAAESDLEQARRLA